MDLVEEETKDGLLRNSLARSQLGQRVLVTYTLLGVFALRYVHFLESLVPGASFVCSVLSDTPGGNCGCGCCWAGCSDGDAPADAPDAVVDAPGNTCACVGRGEGVGASRAAVVDVGGTPLV